MQIVGYKETRNESHKEKEGKRKMQDSKKTRQKEEKQKKARASFQGFFLLVVTVGGSFSD